MTASTEIHETGCSEHLGALRLQAIAQQAKQLIEDLVSWYEKNIGILVSDLAVSPNTLPAQPEPDDSEAKEPFIKLIAEYGNMKAQTEVQLLALIPNDRVLTAVLNVIKNDKQKRQLNKFWHDAHEQYAQ